MQRIATLEEQLKSFEPLIIWVVNSFVDRNHEDHNDALQEARISAWKAIISYNKTKNCKLSWYITKCVRNRMVDLTRRVLPSLNHHGPIDVESDLDLELERVTSFDPYNCIEFDITLRQLLTEKEYRLFKEYYIYGYTFKEISQNIQNEIPMVKSRRKIQGDLKECLHLIYRKLKLNEESLL